MKIEQEKDLPAKKSLVQYKNEIEKLNLEYIVHQHVHPFDGRNRAFKSFKGEMKPYEIKIFENKKREFLEALQNEIKKARDLQSNFLRDYPSDPNAGVMLASLQEEIVQRLKKLERVFYNFRGRGYWHIVKLLNQKDFYHSYHAIKDDLKRRIEFHAALYTFLEGIDIRKLSYAETEAFEKAWDIQNVVIPALEPYGSNVFK